MTPEDRKMYRRERLIALLDEKYNGQQVALANASDISPTLVSRYINGSKGIGEAMASKIEENTGSIGWFSGVSSELKRLEDQKIVQLPEPKDALMDELVSIADRLTDRGKIELIGMAKALCSAHNKYNSINVQSSQ